MRQALADLPRFPAGEPDRAGRGRREDDQAGPGVGGEADDVGRGEVGGQMVDLPVILAQAGRRHHGRQRMPLAGGRCGHGDAAGAALRLMEPGGDKSLADRGRAVLDGDGQFAGGPVRADPAQCRGDDLVTQSGERHSGGDAPEIVPRLGLVPGHQRRVQPVGLRCPVPDPDLLRRLDACRPQPGAGGAGDAPVAAWTWKQVPVPALAPVPPRGRAWEISRYRQYRAQLAGQPVGEIIGRATAFLAQVYAASRSARDASTLAAP
jgi:hypothetical protein